MHNKLLIPLATLIFSAGCLKDKNYDDGKIQSVRSLDQNNKVVSLGLAAATVDNGTVFVFDNVDMDTSFNAVPVQLPVRAEEDVKVSLVLNPALIGAYNEKTGSAHDVAPSDLFTVLNPSDTSGYIVTIPKGEYTGYLQLKVNPRTYLGLDYAIGLQISKVPSGYLISSNLGGGVAAITIKNEWDGVYAYKGYALRAGDNDLTGNFDNEEMGLITAGATSLRFEDLAFWGDGSGIGIGNPVLQIDNSGPPPYPVTITSSGGAKNAPGYDSRYDPDTKTFYISFTWGGGPASRLATDTLTYLRPR